MGIITRRRRRRKRKDRKSKGAATRKTVIVNGEKVNPDEDFQAGTGNAIEKPVEPRN